MKIKLALTTLLIFSLSLSVPASACDLDGDGTDDLFTYEQSGSSWTWRATLSAGGTFTNTTFGESNSYPVPGDYYDLGIDDLGIVNFTTYFWRILRPDDDTDSLNFGTNDVTYMSGKNIDGAGPDDLVKFLGRCNQIKKKNCFKKDVVVNILKNDTDGSETFSPAPTTATGSFRGGLYAIVSLDADNDGDDDICYAKNGKPKGKTPKKKKKNAQKFRLLCRDVSTFDFVSKFKIGKIFNPPLSLRTEGRDKILIWKAKASTGTTDYTILNPADASTETGQIAALPDAGLKPLVGDWLGNGSQQIGVPSNGTLHIRDVVNNTTTTRTLPDGTPLTCHNNLFGPGEEKTLNSKNVCKAVNCK